MKTLFKHFAAFALILLLAVGLSVAAIPALAEAEVTTETTETPAAPAVKPTSVKLSATKTIKLPIGSQLTLTPTLSPANAATTYSWKTSSKKIATVSGGVVTGKKVGTATITVTTANKKKSTVKIKIYDPYLPSSVKLDRTGTVKLPLGETLTLTPTLSPETAQSGFTWKSSSKKIATVSGGVVKGKKVGTATITVTTRNKKKAKVKVKVYDPYLPSAVYLDKTGTQTLLVSNGLQLTAALAPETAQSGLTWKSSNKKVAIVNSDGLVGGLAPGTTTITVTTRNKKTAKVKVKVIDDGNQPITPPAGYNLPYVIYACKNTHTIAIIAKDANGDWTRVIRLFPTATGRKNVTDVGFYYLSKKERWHKWGSGYSPYTNRLSVGIYLHGPIFKSKNMNTLRPTYYNVIGTDGSSGCLRTVTSCAAWVYYNCSIGTMVVIAQNSRFSTPRPAKLKKTATKDPTDPGSNPEVLITSFSVDPGTVTLNVGETRGITPTAVSPSNTSTTGFTFTSDNSGVATVSNTGVVTAVGAGTANIIVTANDDFKCAVAVPVTVNEAFTAAKLAEAEAVEIPEDVAVEETPLISGDAPAETAPAGTTEPAADEADAETGDTVDVVEATEVEPELQEQDGLSLDILDAEAVPEEVAELELEPELESELASEAAIDE